MRRMSRMLFLLSMMVLAFTGSTRAQGVVVGPDAEPVALKLQRHHVDAVIQERVAVVTVEHVFHNTSSSTIEGSFLFPLPVEAQVSRFSMEVDGKEMAGELLSADDARQIYEDIVRKSLDPALLEMADYRTFRARVFPIPPGATRTITLRYDATLPIDGQTVAFRYPMQGTLSYRGGGFRRPELPTPLPRQESGSPEHERTPALQSIIQLHIESATGVNNLYSPSHEIDVEQPGAQQATVTFEASDALDGRDFVLYYSLDPSEIGATLLTHRPYSDQPGYFMLLLAPPVDLDTDRIQPKDIVFVLDTSGSMGGEKIEQAKEALRYSINRLGKRDRFGLVAFSSDVDPFRDALMTTEARSDALFFVDQLEARGGTNINEALLSAMAMLEDSDNGQIIFLTDGLPSTGVTEEGTIRANMQDANPGGVRLFSFGVGYDVNTRLLDGLSREASAFADYISPDENIEERVATFYDKVRYPVMTNLDFELDGVDAYAFAPGGLPDLYKGSQLILAGRYRQPGEATLTLRGQIDDRAETRQYTFRLPDLEREQDFVARLWATRRVGQLLEEIRLNGENEELKDEIVALAKEFGLVTPYTSYLVQEEEAMAANNPQRFRFPTPTPGEAAAAPADAMDQTTGVQAVRMSKSIRAMQEAETAAPSTPSGMVSVQGRTMRQTADGAWMDTAFDPETDDAVQLQFASDAYFTFLRLYPEARAFARLGSEVVFHINGTFVRIGDEGHEQMSDQELRDRIG